MPAILSSIYGKVMDARNALYDRGVFETFDLGAHTVSIGNLTTGGTGKTPLVAYVAKMLAERDERVCILTRGYGRREPQKRILVSDGESILADALDAGDEPYELAAKLLGRAIVIADADRIAAAEWARRRFGVTAFVLDDGFQHRRAGRDVDIVCIDATQPFSDNQMLPVGRLREPLKNLKRANIIVITRSDLMPEVTTLRTEISSRNHGARIFTAVNKLARLTPLKEFHKPTGPKAIGDDAAHPATDRPPAFAFCGIGNPESFFKQIAQCGFLTVSTRSFRDHHRYTQKDIADIEGSAAGAAAAILLTTAKDAVKLDGLTFSLPCFVFETEVEIDDRDAFAGLI